MNMPNATYKEQLNVLCCISSRILYFFKCIIACAQPALKPAHSKTVKKTVSLSGKYISLLRNHHFITKYLSEYVHSQ